MLHKRAFHALAVTACLVGSPAAEAAENDLVARGAYLAGIMVCADCHSPRGPDGAPMPAAGLIGGTVGFAIPGQGTIWGPNLTPASDGAGSWSTEAIIAALTTGIRPDGRALIPVMPWPAYAALSETDARALAVYLQSLEPVDNRVPDPVPPGAEAPAPYFAVVVPD